MKNYLLTFIFIFIFSSNLFSEEANKNKEVDIFKNLRCLVCQGQSIAESNSDFAQTLKLVVKDKINEGMTNRDIYDFLINKYGEWIVYKPKISLQNSLLWFIPYMVLIFGAFILYMMVKNRGNSKNN